MKIQRELQFIQHKDDQITRSDVGFKCQNYYNVGLITRHEDCCCWKDISHINYNNKWKKYWNKINEKKRVEKVMHVKKRLFLG